jgi:hypothetical protein
MAEKQTVQSTTDEYSVARNTLKAFYPIARGGAPKRAHPWLVCCVNFTLKGLHESTRL